MRIRSVPFHFRCVVAKFSAKQEAVALQLSYPRSSIRFNSNTEAGICRPAGPRSAIGTKIHSEKLMVQTFTCSQKDMAGRGIESTAAAALRSVLQRVQVAADSASRSVSQVRVVAVSKTKPVSVIKEVYDYGHRHFGENYVQEIIEKAPELPQDIQWHFIGHLQSNKAKALLSGVPNLYMVEGLDSTKVANHLDRAVAGLGRDPLRVLVQVNTSGEESKFGLDPSKCVELARHVKLECPNLILSGLMTIGMADYTSTPQNFGTLATCRDNLCKELNIPPDQCELSMGMSGDFELAIQMGSTNVRVGSTIFGPRSYPAKT